MVQVKKDVFDGLCSIINEMTSIRQKAQEDLIRRSKDYELAPSEHVNIRFQMRYNTERIQYYTKIKHDLRVEYDKVEE